MPAPTVTVFGNLTREPELAFSAAGKAWVRFTVANTEWKRNAADTGWEEAGASFYDCKMFGDAAERVAESFQKGDRAVVLGKLRQESWETQEGEKRSKMVVIADEVAASTKNATVAITRIVREDVEDRAVASGGSGNALRPGEDPF